MKGLNKCPICGGKLVIKEYYCTNCKSTIRGEFQIENFLKLSQDKLDFLINYLKLRGNLKELGNKMGVSYPTIRLRFDELLDELRIKAETTAVDDVKSKILEILDKMEKGEIQPEQGIKEIKRLKNLDN